MPGTYTHTHFIRYTSLNDLLKPASYMPATHQPAEIQTEHQNKKEK